MNFCPKCGQKRLGKFCGGCGFNFGEVSAAPSVQGSSAVNKDEFTVPRGLIFGEKFDPKKHCHNCGAKSAKTDLCSECE